MKLGILGAFDGRPGRDMAAVASVAAHVEALGFSSLWLPEHVVFFEQYESRYPYNETGRLELGRRPATYDPLLALTVAACATQRIRLGTGILILPQREPVVLAQQVVALDHASAGRFDLGIGVGWSWEEFAALGVPWEGRGARTDDYLAAMVALWTQDLSSHQGPFTRFTDVIAYPKPAQSPHPPIWVGGNSRPALRRAARQGNGWYGWGLEPAALRAALDDLRRCCEEAGRDPGEVAVKIGFPWPGPADGLAGRLEQLAAAGVDDVLVAPARPKVDLRARVDELATLLR